MSKESCIRVYADPVQIRECRKKVTRNEEGFYLMSNILALAGNPVRLKILSLLKEENELCPCDLADILGMTVPSISQHLRKLKDGGIVNQRRAGQTIYYFPVTEKLQYLKPFFRHIHQSETKEETV